MNLSLVDLAGPLQSKGSFAWKGEKVAFDGKLSPARALLGEQRGRIALALNSRLVEASYDGALSLSPAPALEGKATLKAPSVGALTRWLGRHVAGDSGAVDVTATLGLEQGRWPSRTSTGSPAAVRSAARLRSRRARPPLPQRHAAHSDLDLGRLVLRPTPQRSTAWPRPADERAPAPPRPRRRGRLRRPPGKRRATGRAGATTPSISSLLGLADADLAVSADRLLYKRREDRAEPARPAAQGQRRQVDAEEMLLYDGRGRGVLTLEAAARRRRPAST